MSLTAIRAVKRARAAWRAGICGAVVFLAAALASRADEVESRRYTYRWYQADSGLPESEVMGMAQTPDGYIWCATFNGLARFDGKRFVTFDPSNTPELPTDRLTAVDIFDSGALLIYTEFHDVVTYARGRFTALGKFRWGEQGPFEMDEANRIWMPDYTKETLSWLPFGHDGKSGMSGKLMGFRIAGGYLYQLTNGMVRRAAVSSGRWENVDLGLPPGETVDFIYAPSSGVCFKSKNWLSFFDGRSVVRRVRMPASEESITAVRQDSSGAIWLIGYRTDVYRIDPHEDVAREVLDLPWRHAAYTMCGLVDHEDNIWLAISGQGLLEMQPASMRRYGTSEGLPNDIVRTVTEDSDGNIWACTTRGICLISSNGVKTVSREAFAWMACRKSTPGEMWLAHYSDGLSVYTQDSKTLVTNLDVNKWIAPHFTFLFQDSKGLLWFGNSSGLFHYDGTNTIAAPLPGDGPADVRAMAEGPDGVLYAGSNGQGFFVRDKDGKSWRRFGRSDGLESEEIYSLHADSSGALWIGTSGAGLARFDGRRFVFFRKWVDELPRTITGIEDDAQGYLWLASTRAICRVRIADLDAVQKNPAHPAAVTEFGGGYGLPRSESVVGLQPSVVKGRDGRIWFATTTGVVCFDPKNMPLNRRPPPVVIESVSSRDCRIDLATPSTANDTKPGSLLRRWSKNPQTVIAQPGADPIEFAFAGLSFTAPENVQFRYRMENLETNWTQTHERKAVYQRLPPGQYRFRVMACNNDGLWNETGAGMAIVQLPFFWEMTWFKAAVTAAVAALVYGAHRYRLAQLSRVGRLRAQIAADLHDEVGSNMGAVVLNSDLLTMSPNLSASEREQVTDIHRVARNTAQAVREISWFINPDFDFLDEMIARMKEASDRLSNNYEVSFSGPGNAPRARLALEFRRHVMAIYKEALNNATRHSGAKRIDVQVRLESDAMEIVVRDDGRGFAANQVNGGQGLRNLRQRAAAVSGRLDIESKPGAGTTVRLAVELD